MQATDRVLVTSLDDRSRIEDWAACLAAGALVGLGSLEQVRAARRECSALDNVMFIEGSRHQIPWQDAWFSVILDHDPDHPTGEMQRVLAPAGQIIPGTP